MKTAFASTTALLAADFVEQLPGEKLTFVLSKVEQKIGVKVTRRNKIVSIAGEWQWMIKCHDVLLEELKNIDKVKITSDSMAQATPNTVPLLNTSGASISGHGTNQPAFYNNQARQAYVGHTIPFIGLVNDSSGTWSSSNIVDEVIESIETSIKVTDTASSEIHNLIKTVKMEEGSDDEVKVEKAKESEKAKEAESGNNYDEETDVEVEFDEEFADNCKPGFKTTESPKSDSKFNESESKGNSPKSESKQILTKIKKFECQECDYIATDWKNLRAHRRRKHVRKFKCDKCEKSFGYNKDLTRHKNSVHAEGKAKNARGKKKMSKAPHITDGRFVCDFDKCSYVGKSKVLLREHKNRQHRPLFKCDECGRTFGFNKDLKRHKERTHIAPEFFCGQCNKFYKSKRTYDEHIKCHEDDYVKPIFECDVCKKQFSTKYVLAAHLKSEHLGMRKTYLCPICGQSFTQRNSLRQHAVVHTGLRPYVCHICGKTFPYDKSLRNHKLVHEPDTPRLYECQVCGKRFQHDSGLRIHMAVHEETRNYMCTVCGKGFTQKQSLLRHERIHTGEKPYSCQLCKRAFTDLSVLRRHMILTHKRDPKNWQEGISKRTRKSKYFYIDLNPQQDVAAYGEKASEESFSSMEQQRENIDMGSFSKDEHHGEISDTGSFRNADQHREIPGTGSYRDAEQHGEMSGSEPYRNAEQHSKMSGSVSYRTADQHRELLGTGSYRDAEQHGKISGTESYRNAEQLSEMSGSVSYRNAEHHSEMLRTGSYRNAEHHGEIPGTGTYRSAEQLGDMSGTGTFRNAERGDFTGLGTFRNAEQSQCFESNFANLYP